MSEKIFKTSDFKTKTLFMDRAFPNDSSKWVLAIDIGYSSLKSITPNKAFCFPAYARKIPENRIRLSDASSTDIKYRDADGTWVVGALAYDEVNATEVVDSETELFERHRYFSSMFQVIAKTGMAIGLMRNQYGNPEGKRIAVQTGLPPKYMGADEKDIKEALAGKHVFDIQIGGNAWQHFDFELNESDIYVIPQPLGSLISASIDINGKPLAISSEYFSKNLIVFDPGFGTTDEYIVKRGSVIGPGETFPEFGMREVFARTCHDIKDAYGVEIPIPELQNKLDTGMVKVTNRKAMKSQKYSFAGFLEENCRKVCVDTIERMKIVNNYFIDIDYIIATGGTYDAWSEIFNETFRDMEDLKIVPANINDTSLSNVFSNVRGYYFRLMNLRQRKEG